MQKRGLSTGLLVGIVGVGIVIAVVAGWLLIQPAPTKPNILSAEISATRESDNSIRFEVSAQVTNPTDSTIQVRGLQLYDFPRKGDLGFYVTLKVGDYAEVPAQVQVTLEFEGILREELYPLPTPGMKEVKVRLIYGAPIPAGTHTWPPLTTTVTIPPSV